MVGEYLAQADQRSADPDPAHHGVDASAGNLRDDLLRRLVAVGHGFVWIGELQWRVSTALGRDAVRRVQGARIPSTDGEKTTSPPILLSDHPAFLADAIRHHGDKMQT